MDGAQLREFHTPRFAIAVAVIALFAAVLAPTAGATSPSQDQYGSALPGVGGGNGGGSPSALELQRHRARVDDPGRPELLEHRDEWLRYGQRLDRLRRERWRVLAGRLEGLAEEQPRQGDGRPAPTRSTNTATPANSSVPHIAADSAGDSWVPWFIGGLVALGAAGAVLVYRNRRRAAQS